MKEGGKKSVQVLSIAMAAVFGVLYVFQMNSASMKAYTIRDLESHRRELVRDEDRLLTEVDRLRSLSSISEREAFLGMVAPEQVKYVKISNNEVALGK